jgi:hypothetical protein
MYFVKVFQMNILPSAENIYLSLSPPPPLSLSHMRARMHAVYGTQHMTGFPSLSLLLIKKNKISSALPG